MLDRSRRRLDVRNRKRSHHRGLLNPRRLRGSEPLEERRLLAGDPIINEFLAENAGSLLDDDGDPSDWVELFNRGSDAVDLSGWYLTADAFDSTQWQIPAGVVLGAGEYLVVFASGKDRTAAGSPLHTNFQLASPSGFLGLVEPDGATTTSFFDYFSTAPDLSFGRQIELTDQSFVDSNSIVRTHVPASDVLGTTWTGDPLNEPFDDSFGAGWTENFGDVGFESPTVDGFFTVTTVTSVAPAVTRSLTEADALLAESLLGIRPHVGDSFTTSLPRVNFGDGFSSPLGHFDGNDGFGGAIDNFAVRATGTAFIENDQAGLWTFGVAGDDGYRLKIDGKLLLQSEFFAFDDVQASVILTPGPHSIELVYYDFVGTAEVELYAARGHHSEFNSNFRLVGDFDPAAMQLGGFAQRIQAPVAGMQGVNTSVLVRRPFNVFGAAGVKGLELTVDYADGFVAYLNGQQVATVNAPASPTFDSAALASDPFSRVVIDLTEFRHALVDGTNILAFQAMSSGLADKDFLLAPVLTARVTQFENDGFFVVPTPGAANGSIDPVISEFVAANATTLRDDDFDTPDWLELFNPGATDLNLAGWFLTDDPADLDKWQFPSTVLQSQDYLVVFASEKNRGGVGAPLHTNFRISDEGEYLALVKPDGLTVAWEYDPVQEAIPPQRTDISYGIQSDLLLPTVHSDFPARSFFTVTTPGEASAGGVPEVVAEPEVSEEHGLFQAPFALELSTATAGATIRYTTDGSTPTEFNGITYSGPIAIGATTTLRAAAFKDDAVPSEIITQTYLFLADVVQQSPLGQAPQGFPESPINGHVVDYGMDPDIVNSPLYGPQLINALESIPSISLVTDSPNWFDASTGILVNPFEKGSDWERPVSVELIDPTGDDGFQIDAGMRLRGQTSRLEVNPRHSMRLFFRDRYGDGDLEYSLFGDEGVDRFTSLDLRTDQLYTWSYAMYELSTLTRDVFSRDTQRDLGHTYARSRYYHIYLNGQYWGIYQSQEHIDAEFAASNMGGDADDYDVVKSENGTFVTVAADGNLDAWNQLWQAAIAGFATDSAYFQVQGRNSDGTVNPALTNLVDINGLIDYILITFYTGNYDGPITASQSNLVSKNWFGARSKTLNEGFRFFIYDAETTLLDQYLDHFGNYQAGGLFEYFNPQYLHQRLLTNANYRQQFQDRAYELLADGGALSDAANIARHSQRASELSLAIIGESARWGDAQRPNQPFTKANWEGAVNELNESFFPRRGDILKEGLAPRGMYTSVNAPTLNQNGGQVPSGFGLTANVLANPSEALSGLVTFGSSWRFLADGTDQGTAWVSSGFNDSTWGLGLAQLGFGSGGTVTPVSFGPDPNNKYTTTYFRRSFNVADATIFDSLLVQLFIGEGAVVYLNGQELTRSAMPAGPITYSTLASLEDYAPFGLNDATGASVHEFRVPADLLLTGANILAVEVHQEFVNSVDLIFDLQLIGEIFTPPASPQPAAIYYTTDGSDPRQLDGLPNPAAQRLDTTTTLVDSTTPAKFRIPVGAGDVGWQGIGFNDATWLNGTASIGFDLGAIDVQPGFTVRTVDTSAGAIWDSTTATALLNNNTAGFTVSSVTTTRLDTINWEDDISPDPIPGTVDREEYAIRISTTFLIPTGTWTLALGLGLAGTYAINPNVIVSSTGSGAYQLFVMTVPSPTTVTYSLDLFETTRTDFFQILMASGAQTSVTGAFSPLRDGLSGWRVTTTGIGNTPLGPAIGTNIQPQMYNTRSSAYLRVPFQATNVDDIVALGLSLQYDDAFVAYLNGTEVARRSAPTTLTFNSVATTVRADVNALTPTFIDLSAVKNLLVEGDNLLAIHGINLAANNQDFLISPKLEAVYTPTPLTIDETIQIRTRALLGGQWSPLTEATFFVVDPATAANTAITEVHYHPADPTPNELAINATWTASEFEFVELQNTSAVAVDLTGVHFTQGISFAFASGLQLAPGGFLVLVRNPDAFTARYPGVAVAGTFTGSLDNAGERLALVDHLGAPIRDFIYDDNAPWPTRADGLGASLEVVNVGGDYSNSDNFNSSDEFGGSPGTAGTGPINDVVINEVLTNTDSPLIDAVELHNRTAAAIDVGGWYLSDSNNNFKKFRIPNGTVLGPGSYIVFDEDDFNPSPSTPGPNDFSLDGSHGDDVWLLKADASGKLLRFVDDVEFDAAAAGVSIGRFPNATGRFYPLASRTFGAFNSGPLIGPVVISEIMYNLGPSPTDDNLEFIELTNISGANVDMSGWRFDAGVDFTFPAGTNLPASTSMIVLRFDPANPVNATLLSEFNATYTVSGGAIVTGGYGFSVLDDGGETLRLVRPDTPPPDEPLFTPYVLVDEVSYDDDAPWPVSPDGTGDSLARLSAAIFGQTPTNWTGGAPSPGTFSTSAQVVGRHVFYNQSAWDGNSAAINPSDDAAIAPDKVPLLPGGTGTFANYTSYDKGINGIVIDLAGTHGAISTADFQFRAGNNNAPSSWAAVVAVPTITVRPGAGANGSDRVAITFPTGAVRRTWLQVRMLAGPNTNLAADDVFYFGNAVGEAGDTSSNALVNATDEIQIRANPRNILSPAPIDFKYDVDRNKLVNATDQIIARTNVTNLLTALRLIVPAPEPAAENLADAALVASPGGDDVLDALAQGVAKRRGAR